jgi:hypothetical protein
MTHVTSDPTLAAFDSGGDGGVDIYATEAIDVGTPSGPGVTWATIGGHLRTRPAA